jgi:exopolyphosphatase / guanosine-5'-triphosphate,3'-diphosphate pyrophosphatase
VSSEFIDRPAILGVIDLGTNSVRFDLYEVDRSLIPKRIYRKKNMIRLGEAVFESGKLTQSAIKRATFKSLMEFKRQT